MAVVTDSTVDAYQHKAPKRRAKFSGCKQAPFGQGGGSVLFENVAAVEVTVLVEVVVNCSVD